MPVIASYVAANTIKRVVVNAGVFVVEHWRPIVVVVGILVAVGYVTHLRSQLTKLTDVVAAKQAHIAILTTNATNYQNAIASANKQLDVLSARTKNLAAQSAALKTQTRERIKTVVREVKVIEAQPTPTTCPDAIDFMIKHAPKRLDK